VLYSCRGGRGVRGAFPKVSRRPFLWEFDCSWFVAHCAQGEYGPLHTWAEMRFCAGFGGIFQGRDDVNACRERGKKFCGRGVFAIGHRRFCAKKVKG